MVIARSGNTVEGGAEAETRVRDRCTSWTTLWDRGPASSATAVCEQWSGP
jgi:hypothetical protein